MPTLAAPNTYTLRPLRSRKMAEATSETPCPAGLPTRWALTTFRRRWPAVASSHSVTAAVSVPFGNRSTCNNHIRGMTVTTRHSLQGVCLITQALLSIWQQSTAVASIGWSYLLLIHTGIPNPSAVTLNNSAATKLSCRSLSRNIMPLHRGICRNALPCGRGPCRYIVPSRGVPLQ